MEELLRMKLSLCLTLFWMAVLVTAADGPSAVTFVDHQKVAEALAKGGSLVTAPDLLVSGSHRSGAGQVEVHEKETDVMYVVEGHAVFVTGGTMLGGKVSKPGQMLGTGIQGGEVHNLAKGDVVVVPAGTPHWFREVPESISYYVVKVLKQ